MSSKVTLNRTLSLPIMILYGLGTTIGAGIYALVGEITRVSGYFAPLSFLFAALLAGFTAVSFAELSGRYPYAAGASLYVKQAFSSRRLSSLVGLLVATAGMVSAAALLNGFVAYLHQFTGIDRSIAIVLATLFLGGISAWGIAQSVFLASLITVIEIGGLLLVIGVSNDGLTALPSRWVELIPAADLNSWHGIYLGALLSFYSLIGF
jgi:APA family basic amino acid/polyamine antiporter